MPDRLSSASGRLPATRPPLFGQAPAFSPELFQPAFEEFDCFRKYGDVNARAGYEKVSKGVQHHMARLQRQVTPEDLLRFKDENKLGKLEEAADYLFELDSMLVLRGGIIPVETLKGWKDELTAMRESGLPFREAYRQIRNRITPEQVARFGALIDQPSITPKMAGNLLALHSVKFLLHTPKNKPFDTVPDIRRRMMSETLELAEGLPVYSPRRILLLGNSLLAAALPGLPSKLTRNLHQWFARKELDCPLTYEDMMRYVFIKQMGRQELHYEHPDQSYKSRKLVVKPFETLVEASILKEAMARKAVQENGKRA